MQISDAIATATAHGWTDDSTWSRKCIKNQISRVRDGFLAAVAVHTSGEITWNVQNVEDQARAQRGRASSLEEALRNCDDAITAQAGTLF